MYPQQRSPTLSRANAGQTGTQQFRYAGLDGYEHEHNGPVGPKDICCGVCCPCFVGPLWSPEKKKEYIGFMKSFCFVVSIIQIIMFIIELGFGGIVSTSINPTFGPDSGTLIMLGAKYAPLMRWNYQVFRFITPIFLHAGILHIIFNLWGQLRTGVYLERQWGTLKLISVYFITGIAGNLMSSLVQPTRVSVGASGAIMGLMGTYSAELLWAGHQMDPRQRRVAMGSAVLFIVVTMLFSFSPYIDWSAHLAGVVIGFIYGTLLFARDSNYRLIARFGIIVCSVLLAFFFIGGFALFYTVVDVPPY
eukprot:TRINITY_DN5253_c0_g1_i2.p1 TRINITY_DN5253_c0_g1~~TRINITY_DN5253_c0_g1_i2.p1  ORF type:complete len:335 (-),score=49.50 TRINITY_DN5253_c0_g1_i2:80-994(-)